MWDLHYGYCLTSYWFFYLFTCIWWNGKWWCKNIMYIDITMYTCFLFSWKSKNCDHQVQVKMHNFFFCFFFFFPLSFIFKQVWNRTWQTYSLVTQVVYSGAQDLISKWKKQTKTKTETKQTPHTRPTHPPHTPPHTKSYFCCWHKSIYFFLIVHKYEELNHTVILW